MSEFFKSTRGDNRLIIESKLRTFKKQLEDIKEILLNSEDDYASEYTVIFNTILSLENIRMYKLISKNKS